MKITKQNVYSVSCVSFKLFGIKFEITLPTIKMTRKKTQRQLLSELMDQRREYRKLSCISKKDKDRVLNGYKEACQELIKVIRKNLTK